VRGVAATGKFAFFAAVVPLRDLDAGEGSLLNPMVTFAGPNAFHHWLWLSAARARLLGQFYFAARAQG